MVELTRHIGTVDVVQDWRLATAESDDVGSQSTDANAHTAVFCIAPAIPQQAAVQMRNPHNNVTEQFRLYLEGKEGNVLFNDALNTFYLRLYGIRHMVKDHSDSERGNPLPPHGLLFPISSKGSFICIIPQTG